MLSSLEKFETGKTIGIIDLGSNSVRLMIVELLANGAYKTINRVKHMVRLGENAFENNMLQEPAMERTIAVLHELAILCKNHHVSDILALATAAVRDAKNGKEFNQRVLSETGISFNTISGAEEARLIALGVSSGLEYTRDLRLFIDIGGGSTELAIASSEEPLNFESLKLGCVRLTNLFLKDNNGKVSTKDYEAICKYVANSSTHAIKRIKECDVKSIYASSGTALALQMLAWRLEFGEDPSPEQDYLSLQSLQKVAKYICSLNFEERCNLSGLSLKRAEVLVAGAAILQTLVEQLNVKGIHVSTRNLQDGALVDYLNTDSEIKILNIRAHSVKQLALRCNVEKKHSKHVADLAVQLYDSALGANLIVNKPRQRELLYYAANLHDIGIFIAYQKHHAHGYYMIKNTELLGFTEDEVEYMALLAFFHSKKPSKKYDIFNELTKDMQDDVRLYSLLLSMAENMDRLHNQNVYKVCFESKDLLHIYSKTDCYIEKESLSHVKKNMDKIFNRNIELKYFVDA